MSGGQAPARRFRLELMRPRDPDEEHRSATPLEIFFDLVFVVAVSMASQGLHHELADGHVLGGIGTYALVFFGIWWAWMNVTWFATAFATDDWLYRVLVMVQMAGVLVFAAGLDPAFADREIGVLVLGYVIIRVAMVVQWLRAARAAHELRHTALTYAIGISVVQAGWLGLLLVTPGPARLALIGVLILGELAVPVVAERTSPTPWHPHHITERYGLFTIIVLGESLLASSTAILEALHGDGDAMELVSIALLAVVIATALWWIYFWPPHHLEIGSFWRALRWGYAHYLVFGAAAAVSAGIALEVDALAEDSDGTGVLAALTVAVPVSVFMVVTWWLAMRRYSRRAVDGAMLGGAALVLADPILPLPFAVTSLVLVSVVAALVLFPPRETDVPAGEETEDDALVEEDG